MKIKIYSVLSWILFGLTLLLAVYEQIKYGAFNVLGFITDIILQPYLWIALILRWRIKENVKTPIEKEQNVSERKIKRIMSLCLFLVSLLSSVICIIFLEDKAFHRFLFSIAVINGAISVRAFFYVPIFKERWEARVNRMEVVKHYTFYSIMVTIISCILYLGFYEAINDLTNWHFYFLSSILSVGMGLVAPTVVQKFGF